MSHSIRPYTLFTHTHHLHQIMFEFARGISHRRWLALFSTLISSRDFCLFFFIIALHLICALLRQFLEIMLNTSFATHAASVQANSTLYISIVRRATDDDETALPVAKPSSLCKTSDEKMIYFIFMIILNVIDIVVCNDIPRNLLRFKSAKFKCRARWLTLSPISIKHSRLQCESTYFQMKQ